MKKINWQGILDKLWLYTKIFFVSFIILAATYGFGTFHPNSYATQKVYLQAEQEYLSKIKDMELREPEFTYSNDVQFVRVLHKCIDYINFSLPKDQRVPFEMIIGQAALESGWGSSRFANEAKNLFGIRTWTETEPHLLTVGVEKWPGWGVRIFPSKCESVKEYIRILNTHPAYEDFRKLRLKTNDPIKLIKTLTAFSTTDDYDKRVIRIIKKIRKLEEAYASDKTIN